MSNSLPVYLWNHCSMEPSLLDHLQLTFVFDRMFLSVDSEMLVTPHSFTVTLGIDSNLTVHCNAWKKLAPLTKTRFVRGRLLGLWLNTLFMCCFMAASLIFENHKDYDNNTPILSSKIPFTTINCFLEFRMVIICDRLQTVNQSLVAGFSSIQLPVWLDGSKIRYCF